MRILSVVGTRPQIIKAAALQGPLRARHHDVLVDTGQHWDDEMAGGFFTELGLAAPAYSLRAGGGTHAEQTAAMLTGLEPILEAEHPEAVLVYGDTNSTLSGAIAAAKAGIPVAHVEAGLRSFDRRMPEEINRIVADHLSSWLFAPTRTAVENLRGEGITRGVSLVGDLMQDLVAGVANESRTPESVASIGRDLGGRFADCLIPGGYVFATVHRQENRSARGRPFVGRHPGAHGRAGSAGRPGPASRDRGSRPSRGRPAGAGRPRHPSPVVPDVDRAAAQCRRGCHGFRRDPARGGLAGRPMPGAARVHGMAASCSRQSGGLSVLVGLDAERAVRAFTRVVRLGARSSGFRTDEAPRSAPQVRRSAIALALDASLRAPDRRARRHVCPERRATRLPRAPEARALVAAGHEVTIMATGDASDVDHDPGGFTIVRAADPQRLMRRGPARSGRRGARSAAPGVTAWRQSEQDHFLAGAARRLAVLALLLPWPSCAEPGSSSSIGFSTARSDGLARVHPPLALGDPRPGAPRRRRPRRSPTSITRTTWTALPAAVRAPPGATGPGSSTTATSSSSARAGSCGGRAGSQLDHRAASERRLARRAAPS